MSAQNKAAAHKNPDADIDPAVTQTLYGWLEIRQHNSEKSCWVVINNYVVDVTEYLGLHPGGRDPLLDLGGYDATNTFEATGAHTSNAVTQWKKRVIGKLDLNSKMPEKPKIQRKAGGKPNHYSTMTYVYPILALIMSLVLFQLFVLNSE